MLIHGRRDMTCPAITAWDLARAWPGATLHLVDSAGHLGSDESRELLLAALDSFAV